MTLDEIRKELSKPTVIPKELEKYIEAIVQGTHEVTEVTIRPKRAWVSLTDDDAQDVIMKAMHSITGGENTFRLSANMIWVAVVKEVEAKLREKNNGT